MKSRDGGYTKRHVDPLVRPSLEESERRWAARELERWRIWEYVRASISAPASSRKVSAILEGVRWAQKSRASRMLIHVSMADMAHCTTTTDCAVLCSSAEEEGALIDAGLICLSTVGGIIACTNSRSISTNGGNAFGRRSLCVSDVGDRGFLCGTAEEGTCSLQLVGVLTLCCCSSFFLVAPPLPRPPLPHPPPLPRSTSSLKALAVLQPRKVILPSEVGVFVVPFVSITTTLTSKYDSSSSCAAELQ